MSEFKNLSFGLPKKKRYTVDGDTNRVIEIDPGDTGILNRWNGLAAWFEEMDRKLSEIGQGVDQENISPEQIDRMSGQLGDVNNEMREKLNYLFAADVCTPVVGEHGSLIRMVDGEPLFMIIIETLVPLYEAEIKIETEKSRKRMAKHTDKYRK